MTTITSLPSSQHGGTLTSDAGQVAVLQKHLTELEKQMAEAKKSSDGHTDDARKEMLAQQVAAVQAQIAQLAEQAAQKAAAKASTRKEDAQVEQTKHDSRVSQDNRDEHAKAKAIAEGSKVGTNVDTFV